MKGDAQVGRARLVGKPQGVAFLPSLPYLA
jgi:hypothetical protein